MLSSRTYKVQTSDRCDELPPGITQMVEKDLGLCKMVRMGSREMRGPQVEVRDGEAKD